jgi:hypothetical protein
MKYIGTDVRVIEQKLQKPTPGSPLGGAISRPSPHQQRHATPRVVRWPTHARPRDAGPRLPRTGLSHRPHRLAATPVSASAQHPSSSVATRWLLGGYSVTSSACSIQVTSRAVPQCATGVSRKVARATSRTSRTLPHSSARLGPPTLLPLTDLLTRLTDLLASLTG